MSLNNLSCRIWTYQKIMDYTVNRLRILYNSCLFHFDLYKGFYATYIPFVDFLCTKDFYLCKDNSILIYSFKNGSKIRTNSIHFYLFDPLS